MPLFPSLSFLGKTLKPVDSAKDLGLALDSHLTYNSHILNLFSTCTVYLSHVQINRVKLNFDKDTLILMITSLVFNKLLYCSECVYLGCKHQEITTCTELCQQDRNRDKEIRSRHSTLTSTQVATCRTDIIPRGCCYGVQMYKWPCSIVPTK